MPVGRVTMGRINPLPATVQSAAVSVCRDALHWRDDLRAVFLTAGVPTPLYDKYDHLGFSKAKLARAVFNELQERGEPGFGCGRENGHQVVTGDSTTGSPPDFMVARMNTTGNVGLSACAVALVAACFDLSGAKAQYQIRAARSTSGAQTHDHLVLKLTTVATGFVVQRKIVEELCRMTKPHRDAPDQAAGKASLAELKRAATAAQMLIDPEKAAADARRAASQRRVAATQQRRERIGKLRDSFLQLVQLTPGTNADRQDRGYKLERLLADLFRAYDMEYRPSYKVAGEQIDGSFHFRGLGTPSAGDLLTFKAKVDGKIESTRGIFTAMAGYDDDVLEHVIKTARGSRNNVILFSGRDVTLLFEGNVGLEDALTAKIDAAEQEGRMWHPL